MGKLSNTINIIGRAGVTPVVRTFENGVKLAKFSLATKETVTEVNGKKVETQWHNIVAWGKKAELVDKYVKKGQLMAVDGKLINRHFINASGEQKKLTEIQVVEILLINPASSASAKAGTQKKPQEAAELKAIPIAEAALNNTKKAS